jgi:hypothetical protein
LVFSVKCLLVAEVVDPELLRPGCQLLGAVECEDVAAARLGVEQVGEAGLDAGALIEEGEGLDGAREVVRHPRGIFGGLGLDAGQGGAGLLGLDDTGGLAVYV